MTYDGGRHWGPLGTGFPTVAIWQLDLDPAHGSWRPARTAAARTRLHDATTVPALVRLQGGRRRAGRAGQRRSSTPSRSATSATPHATGVTITDPMPDNTSFVSAGDGGTSARQGHVERAERSGGRPRPGHVHRADLAVAQAQGRRRSSTTAIKARSAQGPSTTGSPAHHADRPGLRGRAHAGDADRRRPRRPVA